MATHWSWSTPEFNTPVQHDLSEFMCDLYTTVIYGHDGYLYGSGPVSTQAGKPSQCITSHPGKLSLAIPPSLCGYVKWVLTKAGEWTGTAHNVLQCTLSDRGLMKLISVPSYGLMQLGKKIVFLHWLHKTINNPQASYCFLNPTGWMLLSRLTRHP